VSLRLIAVLGVSVLVGCGDSTPRAPLGGSGTPSGTVFYDENNNDALDAGEEVRIPGVVVQLGGVSATSGPGGLLAFPSQASAATSAAVQSDSLPAFFQAPPAPLPAPRSGVIAIPVRLPIGTNRPNVYMGFGDSLTTGEGSQGYRGYLGPLGDLLVRHWGRATLVNEGVNGTTSERGAERLGGVLERVRPAYTLIHYGTNDHVHACRKSGDCHTLDNLRSMVRETRRMGSLPVIATLLPGNAPDPALDQGHERWVRDTNAAIRELAREEGAALADPHEAFTAEPDLSRVFVDYLHPNDRGYELMARTFFAAITNARAARSRAR
jgi:lysophospholipase L1-like esterase